ncbi:MAG: ABC transporter permease [Acidimicrobiales bacterium]
MRQLMRSRAWLELGMAALTAALAIVTWSWGSWIELAFGVDPDHGSGALEWAIVGAAGAACLGLLLAARRELVQRGGARAAPAD